MNLGNQIWNGTNLRALCQTNKVFNKKLCEKMFHFMKKAQNSFERKLNDVFLTEKNNFQLSVEGV